MLIDIFNLDNQEDLEKEIAELKKKIETYPMPNPPAALAQALAEKEAKLAAMTGKQH